MQPMRLLSVSAQVAAHLRAQLKRGVWVETMPGVGTLAKQLDVDHKSVEAALRQLEQECLLAGQGPGRKRRIVAPSEAFCVAPRSEAHYLTTPCRSLNLSARSFRL